LLNPLIFIPFTLETSVKKYKLRKENRRFANLKKSDKRNGLNHLLEFICNRAREEKGGKETSNNEVEEKKELFEAHKLERN